MVLIDKNLQGKIKVIPQHAIKLYVGVIQGGTRGGLPVYNLNPSPHLKIKSKFFRHRYTGCNRRNGPDFRRVFLRSNYTDITQNTYIQSSMVTEILAREV